MAAPRFFLDVGSPFAYLAAERIEQVLPVAPSWEPVLLGAIFKATGRGSWANTPTRIDGILEVEGRARVYGLPPISWPDPFPGDNLAAMRAATAADMQGHSKAFLLAALRVAFRDGRHLAERDTIAAAAREAGLDAEELLAAIDDPVVKARLRERTSEALALGVFGVPTVVVDGEVFFGDDQLEAAAETLRASEG